MTSSEDHVGEHPSFEGLVDLGSVPPPPGEETDVHAAATAVAQVPDGFLDELRAGRLEEAASMLRAHEEAGAAFRSEAPTRPRDLRALLDAVAPSPEVPAVAPRRPPPLPRRATLPSVPVTFEDFPDAEVTSMSTWRRDALERAALGALAALALVVFALVLLTVYALAAGP